MIIEYRKGNLFNAPAGVGLIQACNCQGSWKSGVAAGFHQFFPFAFSEYEKHCYQFLPRDSQSRSKLVGESFSTWDRHSLRNESNPFLIISLFTSHHYGQHVDSPAQIIAATDRALTHLKNDPNLKKISEIHSPKMNAGLFCVPWEQTADVIEKHLASLGKKWIIWELE